MGRDLARGSPKPAADATKTIADGPDEVALRIVVSNARMQRRFDDHRTLIPASRITLCPTSCFCSLSLAHSTELPRMRPEDVGRSASSDIPLIWSISAGHSF